MDPGHSITPFPDRSAATRWEQIPGWFNWRDGQMEAVQNFTEGSRFVEVGTYLGRSICSLAEVARNTGKHFEIFGVDTCRGSGPEGHKGKDYHQAATQEGGGTFVGQLHRNILGCGFADSVTLIVTPSVNAARLFADRSLAWVHLDAAHDYANVKADIQAWLPKIAPGGWLTGDDYDPVKWPGLVQAVREMLPEAVPWSDVQWKAVIL